MLLIAAVVLLLALVAVAVVIHLRGRSGMTIEMTAPQEAVVAELRRTVAALCAIGERNVCRPGSMQKAADLIEQELRSAGLEVERQGYPLEDGGIGADNVIAEIRGGTRAAEIVVLGAHYDTVPGTAGADDNASGVAAVLSLARRFAGARPERTLRFVAFANEEPPHFQSADMGSWQYARRCSLRKEKVVAMLSIETIGYYDGSPGSQQYPAPVAAMFPDRGNFIAFASNVASRNLTGACVRGFRSRTNFPVESASLPEAVPGIGWSDQWSFWQFGFPAVMVTDTAPYRNPHYHSPGDVPSTLDYESLAHVVEGLAGVVEELTSSRQVVESTSRRVVKSTSRRVVRYSTRPSVHDDSPAEDSEDFST